MLTKNACGVSQRMIIAIHLLMFKDWTEYWAARNEPIQPADSHSLPKSVLFMVQGNPGTGKSFIVRKTRNINCCIMKKMGHYRATAPTGSAASLIDGETDARSFHCLVGCKIKEAQIPIQFLHWLPLKPFMPSGHVVFICAWMKTLWMANQLLHGSSIVTLRIGNLPTMRYSTKQSLVNHGEEYLFFTQ